MEESLCIRQCRERLERAGAAVTRLQAADNLQEAERAWSEFLTAASTIYSKLEHGAHATGATSAWFGRVKKERKDDALLRYIHHARNSDEHGIEDITERSDTTIHLLPNGPSEGGCREFVVRENPRPSLQLTTVVDRRYGDIFDPPGWHLGECIIDFSPTGVAQLAYRYLSDMIDTAAALGV